MWPGSTRANVLTRSVRRASIEGWVSRSNSVREAADKVNIVYCRTWANLMAVNFSQYKMLYIPSNNLNTFGGIDFNLTVGLFQRKADIKDYVNIRRGSMVVLTQASCGALQQLVVLSALAEWCRGTGPGLRRKLCG